MTRYAANTKVSPEKTQAELVSLLRKHGATAHAFGVEAGCAKMMFELGGRRVRFEIRVPQPKDFVSKMPGQIKYKSLSQRDAWCRAQAGQAERQRWRALLLVCKAKLELIAEGLGTVDSEFLAQVVLPDGRVVGQWLGPQLDAVYSGERMPPLLPGAS